MSKTICAYLFSAVLAISVGTVEAQTVIDDGKIDLTSATTQYVTNLSGFSGTVTHIHCTVTQAVTGTPSVYFSVLKDGAISYIGTYIYSFQPTWSDLFLSLQGSGTGKGASVGDTFDIPLNWPFTTAMQIYASVGSAASSGTLLCSVQR